MPLPKKKKILFISLVSIIFFIIVAGWIIFLFSQQVENRESIESETAFTWEKVQEAFGGVKQSIQELSIILRGGDSLEE